MTKKDKENLQAEALDTAKENITWAFEQLLAAFNEAQDAGFNVEYHFNYSLSPPE